MSAGKKVGMTMSATFKSVAEVTGLKQKQVKDILASYMALATVELKDNGKFKFGGMLNVRLKEKPAVPARPGINPFTKQPCVFKAKSASKSVRTSALKKFKLLLADDAPAIQRSSSLLKRPAAESSSIVMRRPAAAKRTRPATSAPKKAASAKAKTWAKSRSRVSDEDREAELNTMIQASKEDDFKKVFAILKEYPPYVNERPAVRRYSVIHQACYWGDLPALKTLVEKHGADVLLKTKDGQTPAEVAKEHGHERCAEYLAQQIEVRLARRASSTERGENRRRVQTTRADGGDGEELELDSLKEISLKLGSEGGGILCGAALVYAGQMLRKAVCYSDKSFQSAVLHSGDMEVDGRREHQIELKLQKLPKEVTSIYLTLCSCGASNLQSFKNPFVELLGDGEQLIRYDLSNAGANQSTVLASLKNYGGVWTAEPVGAVCADKFCGNYSNADAIVQGL